MESDRGALQLQTNRESFVLTFLIIIIIPFIFLYFIFFRWQHHLLFKMYDILLRAIAGDVDRTEGYRLVCWASPQLKLFFPRLLDRTDKTFLAAAPEK